MMRPKLPSVFRWGYVLPRLAVAALVVAAVRWGLDPLLRTALIAGGEAALGAKVDVAAIETSLRGGRLTIDALAATNPSKPMRNLFAAERIELQIDSAALLRKRLVIHSGQITGMQFDSQRETSGELPDAPPEEADAGPSAFDPLVAKAQEEAGAWLDGLSGRFEEDLQSKLQTLKLIEELKTRWPQEYARQKSRVDDLKTRVQGIEVEVREIKKNPLRGLEKLAPLQQELAQLDVQLRTAMAEINAIPEQAKRDRTAIDAARKQDEQFLRSQLQLAKSDPDQIARYLLGAETSDRVTETLDWLRFARKLVPTKNAKIKRAQRSRGVDVVFGKRKPRMLLERVDLEGFASLSGERLDWSGELTDMASEPRLHAEPVRLHLQTTGAVACRLTAQLDRRGDEPCDEIVLDCPKLSLPGRTLGQADRLAVAMSPGDASIHAELRMVGDALTGEIHLSQTALLSASAPKVRDPQLSAAIGQSLAGVSAVAADVQISGTLKRPQWKLKSDLGRQMASGMEGAVRQYLTEKKEKLLAKVQGKVDEQLADLEAKAQRTQQELLAKLGENQQLVTQLTALAGGKPSLEAAVPKLGKVLSLDKLKR